jgi:hypothetical protein
MLTDYQLNRILARIELRAANFLDVENLRDHITEQAATIASLKREVEAHDAALQAQDAEIAALKQTTQAPPGWHKLFMATPTLPIEIAVNGVPIPMHNGTSTEELAGEAAEA